MSSPVRAAVIIVATLCAVTGIAQAARTYKWVDDEGVTHYSQYPPLEGEAQIIEPSIGIPSGQDTGASAADSTGSESADGDGSDADGEDGARTMEAYCKQLREQEQTLASERNVSIRTEDGTLKQLDGDARALKRAEIEQQLEQHCP